MRSLGGERLCERVAHLPGLNPNWLTCTDEDAAAMSSSMRGKNEAPSTSSSVELAVLSSKASARCGGADRLGEQTLGVREDAVVRRHESRRQAHPAIAHAPNERTQPAAPRERTLRHVEPVGTSFACPRSNRRLTCGHVGRPAPIPRRSATNRRRTSPPARVDRVPRVDRGRGGAADGGIVAEPAAGVVGSASARGPVWRRSRSR